MEAWQQRVHEEKQQLDHKIEMLEKFLLTRMYEELTEQSQTLLHQQLSHMKPYSVVLGKRLATFSDTPEMPKYVCHKEVRAVKIGSVIKVSALEGTKGRLIPEDNGLYREMIAVGVEYMQKHKPAAGGYYVLYADGYESFSPAQAFEEGYTLIADDSNKS